MRSVNAAAVFLAQLSMIVRSVTHSIQFPAARGNRHCPTCQHGRADEWLPKQMEKLLPTHYFLLTITLPEQLRDVVRSNRKAAYATLFHARTSH